jgi:hypothetical protein
LKKAWETPKLIVLVRSKQQEAVLEVCKTHFDGDSPDATAGAGSFSSGMCGMCQSFEGS